MNFSPLIVKTASVMVALTSAFTVSNTIETIERIEVLEEALESIEPVIVTNVTVKEVVHEEPFVKIDCPLDEETQKMIQKRSEEMNLDFSFVMAVIFKESSFRPAADSGSSVGLMQINRINHEWLSEELGITDFFDPEQNVKAGTYMLHLLFKKYEDPAMVLMAYNMGEYGAKKLWDKGIYTSDYAEGVLQQADKYNAERMGENVLHG